MGSRKLFGWIFVKIFILLLSYGELKQITLYPNDLNIVNLDANIIKNFLNYTSTPRLVEFYASWCGACIRFSHVFKKLAQEIQNWGIYMSAINCADYSNIKVCSDVYRIQAYPTLKLFHCMEDESKMKYVDMRDIKTDLSIKGLRFGIASFILNNHKCRPPVHISYKFKMSFWKSFKAGTTPYKYIIVIIGSEDDKGIANSLSLDLLLCNRFLIQFVDAKNLEVVTLFGSFWGQSILAVTPDVGITVISRSFDDYSSIRKSLYSKLHKECNALEAFNPNRYLLTTRAPFSSSTTKHEQDVDVYMDDIISGIAITLREEIERAPITTEGFKAIQDWLDAISDCIIWDKDQKEFLHTLKRWSASKGDKLTNIAWREIMSTFEALKAFPLESKWRTCNGSTPFYRGFPCSLWIIFHMMTVNCEKESTKYGIDSYKALLAAREYIVNFFGCQPCREHFKELTKHLSETILSSEEAILHLWNDHNFVNARLRLDSSADPTAPKVQFPSPEMCPSCRNIEGIKNSTIFISTPGYDIEPISWNKMEVLAFLRGHYGPDNIRLRSTVVQYIDDDKYDLSVEYAKSILSRTVS